MTKIAEGRPEEDLQSYDSDSIFPFSHLSHPTLLCNTFLSLFFPQVSLPLEVLLSLLPLLEAGTLTEKRHSSDPALSLTSYVTLGSFLNSLSFNILLHKMGRTDTYNNMEGCVRTECDPHR